MTTSDELTEKDCFKLGKIQNGRLCRRYIESISRILVGPSQMFDVQEALEKID